jgi:cysteine-rich repeat protein
MRSIAVLVALLAVTPALAQNVKAHKAAAERAFVKERWCEAVFLYTELDKVEPTPEYALQAADAAQFADDRAKALSLYKNVLERQKNHPRAREIQTSIDALEKSIARNGNGSACTTPPPECGNGLVEQGETCDDGNTQNGDACPATCTGAVIKTAPVKAPPPPPPPPPLPVVTPAPVPPAPPTSTPESAGEPCTLIKTVKMFQKGAWKTLDFGAMVAIKSRGPQWTIVETTSGEGKIASPQMEGACKAEEAASSHVEPEHTEPSHVEPSHVEPPPSHVEPTQSHVEPTPSHVEPSHVEPEHREPDRHAEPLEQERDRHPASEAPQVKKSGGGVGGWITFGVGLALLAGGGTAATWGALPYFDYVKLCGASFGDTSCPATDTLKQSYLTVAGDVARAKVAAQAQDLRVKVDNAAAAWDGTNGNGTTIPTGRFVFAGGAGAAGLGLALTVTGLIWGLASGGAPPDENANAEDDKGHR